MRDPARIAAITDKLGELWHEMPDLRFWQLLNCLTIPKEKQNTDPFFWEDEVWLQIIENTLTEIRGEHNAG